MYYELPNIILTWCRRATEDCNVKGNNVAKFLSKRTLSLISEGTCKNSS